MMLDKKEDFNDFEDSIAPEEIKIQMPDMSALDLGRSFHQNSMTNESINFNLDDILKRETIDESNRLIEKKASFKDQLNKLV